MAESRRAEIELAASDKKLRRDLQRSKRELEGWAREASGTIAGGFKSAFGTLSALGTVGGLASVGKDVLDVERKLVRLASASDATDAQIAKFRSEVAGVSDETGLSTEKVIDGAQRLVTLTGDFNAASESVALFGRTTVATGAEISDIAGTSATLIGSLGIKVGELGEAFDILHVQGKKGSVELSDQAKYLTELAPLYAALNEQTNRGTQGLVELGAAFQIAAKGAGSPAEAATSLKALFASLTDNAAKFQKAGVQIFVKDPTTGVERMRRFADVIEDIAKSDLAKSPDSLRDAFGSGEALQSFLQLQTKWGLFQEVMQSSTTATGAVQRDFERYMASSAGRIEQAWTRMRNSIASEITPDRVEMVANAAIRLAEGVGWAADNWEKLAVGLVAFKGAQFSLAAVQFAGGLQAAAKNATGLMTQVQGVYGGLGKAAAAAGGMAASLTAGFQAGLLLREVLFPEEKTANSMDEYVQELSEKEARIQKQMSDNQKMYLPTYANSMNANLQRQLDDVRKEKAHASRRLEEDRDLNLATDIAKRDQRETGGMMADDYETAIRQEIVNRRLGYTTDEQTSGMVRAASPELKDRSIESLERIADQLAKLNGEQEKHRKILERGFANGHSGTPQATAAVPATGRAPI